MKLTSILSIFLQAGSALTGTVPLGDAAPDPFQHPLRHQRAALKAHPDASKRALLQDVVTFDEHSLFVHGERVLILSGEFHPFRLPSPSLWLDVFQKVRALGFNCVSFYAMWGLLEGQPGNFTAEGVFDFQPFFDAALKAGVWLIARPGPYINAEVSFGGFPGWRGI
jgi:hypothetical protein